MALLLFRVAVTTLAVSVALGCTPIDKVDQGDFCFANYGECFIPEMLMFFLKFCIWFNCSIVGDVYVRSSNRVRPSLQNNKGFE